jgi:hypothetical protein
MISNERLPRFRVSDMISAIHRLVAAKFFTLAEAASQRPPQFP